MSTTLETARDVDGVSSRNLNRLIHRNGNMLRNLRSFVCWYCRRRKQICTTARSVASFHPRISVCLSSATFVYPSAMETRKSSILFVMKPTTAANITRPKMTSDTYRNRSPNLSGTESSTPAAMTNESAR